VVIQTKEFFWEGEKIKSITDAKRIHQLENGNFFQANF